MTRRRATRAFVRNFLLWHLDLSRSRNFPAGETRPAYDRRPRGAIPISIVTRIQNRRISERADARSNP
jgi:hypothetical protein